jgi:hypothetical protein
MLLHGWWLLQQPDSGSIIEKPWQVHVAKDLVVQLW